MPQMVSTAIAEQEGDRASPEQYPKPGANGHIQSLLLKITIDSARVDTDTAGG